MTPPLLQERIVGAKRRDVPARGTGKAVVCVQDLTVMRAFRHITFLHRLALAWFMLSLGVGLAGPILQPKSIEIVFSSAGALKVIVHGGDGAQEQGSDSMDCAPCAIA